MLKHFRTFLGYDLRTGCQVIAVASATVSVCLAPFFFYVMVNGLNNVKNPDFSDYGSVHTFSTFSAVLGVKQITHLIFCFMLYTGSRSDNVYGIRSWLKSNVIGLCMLGVLGSYCNVLLFVGGSTGLAVTCVLLLLVAVPGKIYFGLVVNSYHATLAPDHIWGASMRVHDNCPTRSCHTLPALHVQQPTVMHASA